MSKKIEKLPPVPPGEVLLRDFMKPLGLSQYRGAKDIGVPTLRISQIVRGQRSITADTALWKKGEVANAFFRKLSFGMISWRV